jgi:hypothetical protein
MHNLSCSKEVSTGSEHDGSQAPPGSKQRRDGGGRRSWLAKPQWEEQPE